ncbi:MAG: MATE family efflux transporter [Clostridiales bacterium]|nr:MATE family efflux transporter [Clostridiales bacterium]
MNEVLNTGNDKNTIKADVIKISWPVLVELLLSSLFGMVDMMMIGRISDTALAAASVASVGITNQPLFMGLSLVQALNVGATAMISRYHGAKQNHRIENVLRHVMLFSMLLLAIPLSILGLYFTNPIMTFLGAQADALLAGRIYFKIIMVGFLFQSLNMSMSAALRGIGETKIPMRVNLFCNFLNVIGNAVLIYGLLGFPQMGIAGAGLSTALSNVVASLLLLGYLLKGEKDVKLNIKTKFSYDKNVMRNLIKIGVPASMEQVILRVGIIMFFRIIAGLGTVIYAAHNIALSILSLSFQPGQAFGIAAATLVGRELGAKNTDKAEEYAKATRSIGSMISTIMAVIFFFFGAQIVGFYTKDPVIIKNTSNVLRIIALVQPFQSSQLILAGALRGAGDTFWPLVTTFVGIVLIRVIIAHLLVNIFGYGLTGAWVAVFIDQIIRWAFIYFRFRTDKWKYIKFR